MECERSMATAGSELPAEILLSQNWEQLVEEKHQSKTQVLIILLYNSTTKEDPEREKIFF